MKICCISDSHGHTFDIDKDTDLILHAGDFTHTGRSMSDNFHQWYKVIFPWLKELSSHSKVVGVFGNHDWVGTKYPITEECKRYDIDILEHGVVHWNGLTITCSSYQPIFYDWAFNRPSEDLQRLYAELPPCDILLTHSPAFGYNDFSPYGNRKCGSSELLAELPRIRPRLAVAGHLHSNYKITLSELTPGGTPFIYVGASVTDEDYKLVRQPIYLEW